MRQLQLESEAQNAATMDDLEKLKACDAPLCTDRDDGGDVS